MNILHLAVRGEVWTFPRRRKRELSPRLSHWTLARNPVQSDEAGDIFERIGMIVRVRISSCIPQSNLFKNHYRDRVFASYFGGKRGRGKGAEGEGRSDGIQKLLIADSNSVPSCLARKHPSLSFNGKQCLRSVTIQTFFRTENALK